VNDFESPFIIERNPFVDVYMEALEALAACGVIIGFRQRIPIFKLYTELQKRQQTDDVVYALGRLDLIRVLMARGLEPEHKNNTYT